jgi:hypothetical protein
VETAPRLGVEKMKETGRTENLNDAAYKSADIVDCKSYVNLKEPESSGFGNRSKSINDFNDAYSHDVVDFYGP